MKRRVKFYEKNNRTVHGLYHAVRPVRWLQWPGDNQYASSTPHLPPQKPGYLEAPTESGEKILIGCPLSNFADKSIAYVRAGLELYAKDNPI
jgi:hypothetical protein